MKTRSHLHTLLAPALFLLAGWAQALEIQPYAANTLQQLQTQGKAVALHFHADWCPTCRAQETSLRGLQGDPQLKDVTLLVVNYDNERDLKKTLKVRAQSTLLVFKGNRETARQGGETAPDKLKAALLTAR
ncbi:MAG: thioredoxin [Neisseriaceae bacterium]|nr:MAG: thioredoxin [Neisseriaceae bacterium]